MEVSEYKCDVCGKKAEGQNYDAPEGWYRISCQTEDKGNFWEPVKDVCPVCAPRGLPLINEPQN